MLGGSEDIVVKNVQQSISVGEWKYKINQWPGLKLIAFHTPNTHIQSDVFTQHPVRYIFSALGSVLTPHRWPPTPPSSFDSNKCKAMMQYLRFISAWYLTCCALCRQLHILSRLVPLQPTSFVERRCNSVINIECRVRMSALTVWMHWWRFFLGCQYLYTLTICNHVYMTKGKSRRGFCACINISLYIQVTCKCHVYKVVNVKSVWKVSGSTHFERLFSNQNDAAFQMTHAVFPDVLSWIRFVWKA